MYCQRIAKDNLDLFFYYYHFTINAEGISNSFCACICSRNSDVFFFNNNAHQWWRLPTGLIRCVVFHWITGEFSPFFGPKCISTLLRVFVLMLHPNIIICLMSILRTSQDNARSTLRWLFRYQFLRSHFLAVFNTRKESKFWEGKHINSYLN